MRSSEHLRHAELLYREAAPAEAIADQLLLAADLPRDGEAGPWAAPILSRAARGAARTGDVGRACRLLERSLRIVGVTSLSRIHTLIELGRCEAAAGFSDAGRRWEAAEDRMHDLPAESRVAALTELGEATYSSGLVADALRHYDAAYRLATDREDGSDHGLTIDDETMARIVAGLSTASLLTGSRHPHTARLLRTITESPPRHPTVPTRALMASAAGEVALGVDRPAGDVHRLVDLALGDDPLPATVARPAVESLAAALSLTGRPHAATRLLDRRLDQATSAHDVIAHVSLLPLRAHAHLLAGDLEAARVDAQRALELIAQHPSASRLAEAPTRYVLALVALEKDDVPGAYAAVAVPDHRQRWGGTPMHGWFLDALARVQVHDHRHESAVGTWTEAGREFTLVGGTGVVCEWRDGLARSLASIGANSDAIEIATDQLASATAFGDHRMRAISRGTCAAVEPDHNAAADQLAIALRDLPTDVGALTRCRLGYERGARLRRAGRRRAARDQLTASVALASRLGALHLSRCIDDELSAAGGRPATPTACGPLALTFAERQTAQLAADGLSNAEIARHRAISRKTVEAQLSSLYRKLGIADRHNIAAALTD